MDPQRTLDPPPADPQISERTTGCRVTPRPVATGPHVPSVVWGVLLALVTALCLAGPVLDVQVDVAFVVPVAMVVLGLLLVLAGAFAAVRAGRNGRR